MNPPAQKRGGGDAQVVGLLMPELQEILPEAFAARIKRQGIVNAWDDEHFANACRNTGKRNLVMAGVTTDVCMVAPALGSTQD
jgi:nicotinamidase-related amidase